MIDSTPDSNWMLTALGSTPSGSTQGELNNTDALRSLRVGLTVVAAQAGVLLLQYVGSLDFGDKSPVVSAIVVVAIDLIRRKYTNNKVTISDE